MLLQKKENSCVLMVMDFKEHLRFQCLWGRCTCMCVRREEERARKERIKGRRETEGEERIPFIRVYLSYVVNISFEGRRPMTHSVKSSKLIVVDFESWGYSFVIVGISFRSASCISAPTF